jgi:hypothetical protein
MTDKLAGSGTKIKEKRTTKLATIFGIWRVSVGKRIAWGEINRRAVQSYEGKVLF